MAEGCRKYAKLDKGAKTMNTSSITEDGMFVIPPYIQSQTGLMPGASVEYEADGSALVIRLSGRTYKPMAKPIWEYAGMFNSGKSMTVEEMDEAMMDAAAAHCFGEE